MLRGKSALGRMGKETFYNVICYNPREFISIKRGK
jgi:hypothetical protein